MKKNRITWMYFSSNVEKLVRFWFIVSICSFLLFAGWCLARLGLDWMIVIPLSFFLILLTPFKDFFIKNKPRNNLKRYIRVSIISSALLLGFIIEKMNVFSVNEWMKNSIAYIYDTVHPLELYTGPASAFPLSAAEQKKMQKSLSSLQLFPNEIHNKILVSFNIGLAVLNQQKAHFLTSKGVTLALPSPLPDQSIIYYSNLNILTRAVIRNDTLHKIWERKLPGLYLHHWGDSFEDKIYLPGRDFVSLPNTLSSKIGYSYAECNERSAISDTIYIFNLVDGKFQESIRLLPLLAEFGERNPSFLQKISYCKDPIHLNDIQLIKTKEHANFFPDGKVGDMLISLRLTNSIHLIDKDTRKVKWSLMDKFTKQHSPRITNRGTLLIFDNLGSDPQNGASRILEIDISSQNIVGKWEAVNKDFFESKSRGKVDIFDDMLIVQDQDWHSGRNNEMFALDCDENSLSMTCKKQVIFSGKPPHFQFDNAVFLE